MGVVGLMFQTHPPNFEKTTGPIFLKFWQKFLLQSTIEIQK